MAYKQTQGRSEFSKTGRGISSKLAGPEDPPSGGIKYPSEKNIRYTGGGNKYEYVNQLRDSLQSVGKPVGNLKNRFSNAFSSLETEEQDSKLTKMYNTTARANKANYLTSNEAFKNRRLVNAAAERTLMSLESQIEKKKKK
jgi:hypothetical protein